VGVTVKPPGQAYATIRKRSMDSKFLDYKVYISVN